MHSPATLGSSQPLKILGIPGSVRAASYSRAALVAAQQLLPSGVSLELYDLVGLPPFNQDMNARPVAKLAEFKRKIREADAILFSAPEYLHSILAVLNNAIDSAAWPCGDNAWAGKPVAVMGVCNDTAADGRAQHQLRHSLASLAMRPVSQAEVLVRDAGNAFDKRGALISKAKQAEVRYLLKSLVHATQHGPATAPAASLSAPR